MADWITTVQAIQLTGYSEDYIRRLIRAGKIKGQKWGREWQVSRRSLLAYVREAEQAEDKRKGPRGKAVT